MLVQKLVNQSGATLLKHASLGRICVGILSFFYVGAVGITANNDLPDIGSSASRSMSLVQEQLIGDDYMRQLRRIAPIINDAEINDYIQHLGFKLVENNPNAYGRQFSFFILSNDAINAFAMPGGYIALHTGLITRSDNESELASVISHEIAHVTQRHLARRLEKQKEMTLPSVAAFIAAILIASQAKSSDTAIGAIAGAQGLVQQAMLNHSRANESEADRIGLTTLYNAGYDPNSAISFFEKMQQNQRYHSNAYEFLRTHPLSRTRITDARLRARKYPNRQVVDRPIYHLMKAKIKAITESINPVTIDAHQKHFKKGDYKTEAEQYGHAIFMIRANQFAVAEKILKKLRQNNPKQPSYAIALAELNIYRKTPKNSIPVIESLLEKSPSNLALVDILAQLLLANKNAVKARELLLKNIHMTLHAPYLLKLLSSAQEKAGYQSEAYETEGNYFLSVGDIQRAKIKYEQALDNRIEDPYARQRINSLLNKIDEVLIQRSLRR